MSAGKGDSPRPVNGERYRSNFDRIFRGNADRPSCMDRINDKCRKAGFDPWRDYPTWICWDCGHTYGRRPAKDGATWHQDECGICGMITQVTQPRDFGHLNLNQQTNNDK